MSEDEIEIHFPAQVPEELKAVVGISDAMKSHIAKKIAEGKVKIQSYTRSGVSDSDEKCEMVLEILQDRACFDKSVTVDEILEIMDEEDKYLPAFIQKLMKLAREREIKIRKSKYLGKTCYKI
jgi:hypothetical protein